MTVKDAEEKIQVVDDGRYACQQVDVKRKVREERKTSDYTACFRAFKYCSMKVDVAKLHCSRTWLSYGVQLN